MLPLAASAQEIYQQRFNDESIEMLDGAKLGPDASGVSGKPGDRAYSADTSVSRKAVAVIPAAGLPEGNEIDELTVTAWYKPAANDEEDATTLFSALGSVLIWDATKKHWVWRIETDKTDGSPGPYWFYLSSPPLGEWMKPGAWTFIALVWKRDQGLVRFYQGDPSAAPVLGREITRPEQVAPLKIEGKRKNTIGNDRLKTERAFGGEIDNVRFFGNALDDDQLSVIFRADVANESAPSF